MFDLMGLFGGSGRGKTSPHWGQRKVNDDLLSDIRYLMLEYGSEECFFLMHREAT
jgi:hypothetical protein